MKRALLRAAALACAYLLLQWWFAWVTLGEGLGVLPETARSYAALAGLLDATGERFRELDAGGWRERAREAFDALGLRVDLERLASS